MEPDIVTLIANNTGMAALAIFALWMLNKVWQNYVVAEGRRIEELGQLRTKNLECLKESATVISANTEVMRANNEVMRQNNEIMTRLLDMFEELDEAKGKPKPRARAG